MQFEYHCRIFICASGPSDYFRTIFDSLSIQFNFKFLLTSRSLPFHRLSIHPNTYCRQSIPRKIKVYLCTPPPTFAPRTCVEPLWSPVRPSGLGNIAVPACLLPARRAMDHISVCTAFCIWSVLSVQKQTSHLLSPTLSSIHPIIHQLLGRTLQQCFPSPLFRQLISFQAMFSYQPTYTKLYHVT